MKLEAMRCIRDGLADATNGINAKLAALTLDGADTRPANPTRAFDVDDAWVARRSLNAEDTSVTLPALAVFQFEPLQVGNAEILTVVRDASVRVAFAYLLKKQDSDEAVRDGLYFNRALLRWFAWFMSNDQTSAFRTKNGIIIRTVTDIVQPDVVEDWGAAVCTAVTFGTFHLRETSP